MPARLHPRSRRPRAVIGSVPTDVLAYSKLYARFVHWSTAVLQLPYFGMWNQLIESGIVRLCDISIQRWRGAWCATSVGQEREYLGLEHAGTCGPSCARPQPVNELERSRCHSSASALNGGFAHCAPSPSPPPHPPVSPPPPPPGLPPSNPPPVIELLISILPDLTVVLVGCACLTASLCRCLYWACCPCWSRRYRRGRPREIDATELQALAGTRMDNNWLEPKATRQSLKVGERLRR